MQRAESPWPATTRDSGASMASTGGHCMSDHAATVRCSAHAVLLALLIGATAAPACAATTEWRAELARGGDEVFGSDYPVLVAPVRDGFWLSGKSFEVGWIGRYANDGSRIGLQRFFGPIGSGRS